MTRIPRYMWIPVSRHRVRRESRVKRVNKDLRESRVKREIPVSVDLRDILVCKAREALKVMPVLRVLMVKLDRKALLDLLARLVKMVQMVLMASRHLSVIMAIGILAIQTLAIQAVERWDLKVRRASRVTQEPQDHKV